MSDKTDLTVVVPVYNEDAIIATVIKDWFKTLQSLNINYQILLLNDGSKDNSKSVIEATINELNSQKIRFIDKPNSGHGPTILMGYKMGLHSDWIFQVDSDNEMPAEYFPEFWKIREQYDFLIGSRGGRQSTIIRKIISLFAKMSIQLLFGSKIQDVNSPYRLLKVSKFTEIIQRIPESTFAPNIIVSGFANSFKIFSKEIPYTFRQTGTVSLKQYKIFWIGLKCAWQTISFKLSFKKKLRGDYILN
jgi:glycosyltransferase involved in cell wall biosynthesis